MIELSFDPFWHSLKTLNVVNMGIRTVECNKGQIREKQKGNVLSGCINKSWAIKRSLRGAGQG